MTIDENYTERLVNAVAKTLVEAFETLTIEDVNMYRLGYTKAIDDFVKKLEEHQQENWVDNLEYGITWNDIEQVAEQLKEGGVDE